MPEKKVKNKNKTLPRLKQKKKIRKLIVEHFSLFFHFRINL